MKILLPFSLVVAALVITGCASVPYSFQCESIALRTESCKATNEQEMASLFDRWNSSLQAGDQYKVVPSYAARSILLPTVSDKARLTAEDVKPFEPK